MVFKLKIKAVPVAIAILILVFLLYGYHSWGTGSLLPESFDKFGLHFSNYHPDFLGPPYAEYSAAQERPAVWDSTNYVQGLPTERFRDNLRNATYYVTSWKIAGFTNQFISDVNMLYLGIISNRIPVIPPFAPYEHISRDAGPLAFSDVFNLTELRRILQRPILEWSEVKALASTTSIVAPTVTDEMGCWSTRAEHDKEPYNAPYLLEHLGLDVSYTRVPRNTRQRPEAIDDSFVQFFPVSELIFPEQPSDEPGPIFAPSPRNSVLGPETHMACFDLMYYAVGGRRPYEWDTPYSPAWRFVGRYLKFTDAVRNLGRSYVQIAFGVTEDDEVPPFIAVHVRRGDFVHHCSDTKQECVPSLAAYVDHVTRIQTELLSTRGLTVSEVLLTSDETEPAFWADVEMLGWKYIDHIGEKILRRHGEWYSALIDIVAQSFAAGFVGTKDSTVSMVSRLRVHDWNGGITINVGR